MAAEEVAVVVPYVSGAGFRPSRVAGAVMADRREWPGTPLVDTRSNRGLRGDQPGAITRTLSDNGRAIYHSSESLCNRLMRFWRYREHREASGMARPPAAGRRCPLTMKSQ